MKYLGTFRALIFVKWYMYSYKCINFVITITQGLQGCSAVLSRTLIWSSARTWEAGRAEKWFGYILRTTTQFEALVSWSCLLLFPLRCCAAVQIIRFVISSCTVDVYRFIVDKQPITSARVPVSVGACQAWARRALAVWEFPPLFVSPFDSAPPGCPQGGR